MAAIPIAKIFWSLFALYVLGLIAMFGAMTMNLAADRRVGAPDGGLVGAWIILIPPVAMAILAVLFLLTSSPVLRAIYTVLLAWPVISLGINAVRSIGQADKEELVRRLMSGDDYFPPGPARELAHAIRDGDPERIRPLIAAAGDLNKPYGDGVTLARFAITNVKDDDAGVAIMRAMIDAGADGTHPEYLFFAILHGPRVTAMLLRAGADPNDGVHNAGRPVWWMAISILDQHRETLRLLLDNGADVHRRGPESGAAGWAAHEGAWHALLTLVERGAAWRDEFLPFDERVTVSESLRRELVSRRNGQREIPPEMLALEALFEGKAAQ